MKPYIDFTKMHGISNDYVYINCFDIQLDDVERLAIEMSNRRTGIGGDGIILILPSDEADAKMRIFNADGSEGMMCGNGIRCVGKYLYDNGIVKSTTITVETLSGIKTLWLTLGRDELVESVTVDMGRAILEPEKIPVVFDGAAMIEQPVRLADGRAFRLTAVSMGNPHGVIFIDTDPEDCDVEGIGRELEVAPMWPARANIEFARVNPDGSVSMRVWERGSGETWACGTGACAVATAAVETGRTRFPVTVHLRGGSLEIDRSQHGHILMTGPATTVFTGRWPLR